MKGELVMLNEFEIMCKKLDTCKKGCINNKYICAEKAVQEYVNGDKKKLLQLKAQAEAGDFYSYSAFVIAVAALIVTCVDTMLDVPNITSVFLESLLVGTKILLIVCPTVYMLCNLQKYVEVLRWRKYILVAIEEVEKKFP